MDWKPMSTAPKDGSPVRLLFDEGKALVASGTGSRSVCLPQREVEGRWWSAEDVYRKVGKRSREGLRGSRIEQDGGYWGGVNKSKPMAGTPQGWKPIARLLTQQERTEMEEATTLANKEIDEFLKYQSRQRSSNDG
jgi:hypothetical protein